MTLEQVQGETTEDSEVFSAIENPQTGIIFAKDDIQWKLFSIDQ
jgi:hypothetical protein